MKNVLCSSYASLGFMLVLTSCGGKPTPLPEVSTPTAYVAPTMGSGGFGFGYGASFPGAAAPFGLAKVGPDTRGSTWGLIRFLHFTGYWYDDEFIQGFSHLHLHGAGGPDYGVLTLMPTDAFDAGRTTAAGYESSYAKASEVATPGYYAATLDRGGIRVELTAARHAAHHRYDLSQGGAVVIDLAHHLDGGSIHDAELTLAAEMQTFSGRLHSVGDSSANFGGYDVFFAGRARRPWREVQVWQNGAEPATGAAASGTNVGAALLFDAGEPVEIQVGLSFVSIAGAQANLDAEMPAWDFDGTHESTVADWNALLGAVRIAGGSNDDLRTFYSSLYHAFLMPTVASDVDGTYAFAGSVRHADFPFLTDMSLWDTYRTVHPFYALVAPDWALAAVRSLHAMALALGYFPIWPLATNESGSMLGANSDVVISDAYLRGVTGFDAAGAYALLRAAALDPTAPPGGRGARWANDDYERHGYVPATTDGRSLSLTLEYAEDDFALSGLAAALGEGDDARHLATRSLGYRALYDPASGFLRERLTDGSIAPGEFDPFSWQGYAEANAWQSLWAQHDISGVVDLVGGMDAFIDRLGQLFGNEKTRVDGMSTQDPLRLGLGTQWYFASNEPDIHVPYAFAQVGRPDLTQQWVRWGMRTFYSARADGLPGNDDGGAMSCWYVWSALGLYPIAGSDRFVIGAPLFPRARIAVAGGWFTIDAEGAGPDAPFVQSVELDGQAVDTPELRQGQILAGRTLHFVMGNAASRWGKR